MGSSEKHSKKDAASDEAARLKKEKKEKKRSEKDGVHKKDSSKKDKKEKKSKQDRLEKALDEHLQTSAAAPPAKESKITVPVADADAMVSDDERNEREEIKALIAKGEVPKGALVSFALPLADDKVQKKVLKTVKKATKKSALLRGVKEVNKALRKAPGKSANTTEIPGVVVIAGDISPAEVIMHLPIYCEERNVPYIFVPSRAELGAAAKTKRPTSVVMLLPKGRKRDAAKGGKKPEAVAEDDGEEDDYPKAYQDLAATAQKEFAKQLRSLL
ncbi:H/ACA ribonucleoprotein complex subunit 2 [Magnaporthiopsis poae ATCC 64411]|uniref:H/ACA ribonucleoprotein complex subunit 2 n=1 Tax=Magnaporthiopsis poae (strain ATCC 64411 / 73-15) TaxID=644358 RepID=A0A0C4DSJ8_MAGP6|nr:H/ACA ribonucleoprotein complex subunit 2 [Magnaporthiopsis poae ATCC 64411]